MDFLTFFRYIRLTFCCLAGVLLIFPSTPAHAEDGAAPYTEILLAGARIGESPLATADFNGDGYKEIIAGGEDGILYVVSTTDGANWNTVWAHQTNDDILAAGPPTAKAQGTIASAPAIADLDRDGTLEIIIAVGGAIPDPDLEKHYNGGVLVYTYTGPWTFTMIQELSTDRTSGWPQPRIDEVGWPPPGYSNDDGYWDGLSTTPAIGDLDGDGDLEITVEGGDRRLHAWHHDGSVVDGWPIYRGNGDNMSRGGLASPAIGDLDGDGDTEVVFGTMNNETTLWVVDGASNPIPGFPITVEQYIHSSPALGDIDGDGDLEIVAGSGWGKSGGRENLVFAWHHDGTPVTNWPQVTESVMQAPPALGDIDGDGDLEIVIGCGGLVDLDCDKLYAWHGDGTAVNGFPVTLPPPQSYAGFGLNATKYGPLLADFDGDGTVEIIVNQCTTNGILIVEPTGEISDTSHVVNSVLMSPPMIDDVDNDGKLEILVGHAYHVTLQAAIGIWHEEGAASSAQPWPMYRQNSQRAGAYGEPEAPELNIVESEIVLMHQSGDRSRQSGPILLSNNGGGEYDWQITHSIPGLTLSANSGTFPGQDEITYTLDVSDHDGEGWIDIGTLMVTGTVDGAVVAGSPQRINIRLFSGELLLLYLPLLN